MPPDSCSIIIRAFNEEQHIGRLLSGILRQSLLDREIILVDSGSTDATLSIASRFPVEILQIPPEEFTFGHSLNVGCGAAQKEILVFASAHVYPIYPDWLDLLLKPFEDLNIALVYGRQRGNETTKFSEHQHFTRMYPELSNLKQKTPICNNANAAIRRTLWEKNAYDEELPGLEDLAWANWALREGYHLAYVAEASVVHVHDEVPLQVYNRYRREAIALKTIQPEEHFGFLDFLRLYISNVISDLWHAIREGLLFSKFWEILWFRWMQFWGTYRGYAFSGPITGQLIRAFFYPRGFDRRRASSRRKVSPIEYGGSGENYPEHDPK